MTASDRASFSGPRVARLFQCVLAVVFIAAWLSLGSQVSVLVGKRGLLPAAELVARVAEHPDVGWLEFPSLFRNGASETALSLGVWLGVLTSLGALLGLWPRACFAVSTLLYLSYCVVARSFLAFQWDNLLIECGVLAALLPTDRPALWIHTLLRVLVFKLYFESGIAKYQSVAHDWQDGSAMVHYYETAPLPTWLAFWFHHLPAGWHHFESRATLVWEIGLPFLIFAPRRARWVAVVGFTLFQLLDIATANYGFFCYLALFLNVVLIGERDVVALRRVLFGWTRRVRQRLGPRARELWAWGRFAHIGLVRLRLLIRPTRLIALAARLPQRTFKALRVVVAFAIAAAYIGVSVRQGIRAFVRDAPELGALDALSEKIEPLRVVNVYHLFGHITTTRYEPDFQLWDGTHWKSFDLNYKPGDPMRPPPFVAPHQPRVDFLLWFYGLSVWFRDDGRALPPRTPDYVESLLRSLCLDPEAVQPLFVEPLPSEPIAVRIVFWDTHFVSLAEHRETGAYWRRTELTHTRVLPCRPTAQPPPYD